MKKVKLNLIHLFAVSFLSISSAQALSVAGYEFDDNAFGDYLYNYSDGVAIYDYESGFNYTPTEAEIEASVVGSDFDHLATLFGGEYLTLGFSDNYIVNGDGADFVIFEMAATETGWVDVQLMDSAINYAVVDTGFDNDYGSNINAVEVDLSDFGLAIGAVVDLVTITGVSDFDLAAIGALNTAPVPEPSTMLLLGAGGLGLLGWRRRTKSQG